MRKYLMEINRQMPTPIVLLEPWRLSANRASQIVSKAKKIFPLFALLAVPTSAYHLAFGAPGKW